MDIMEDFLKMMNWKYLRLDGGTKTEERASFVQLFNAKNSEYMVFILSTRAGGLGLNLQTADTVVMYVSSFFSKYSVLMIFAASTVIGMLTIDVACRIRLTFILGILMRIFKHKIVRIVSARRVLFSFCGSLPRRVSRKLCISVPVISLISTTRSFKLVVLTTSLHRRSRRSFWYASLLTTRLLANA